MVSWFKLIYQEYLIKKNNLNYLCLSQAVNCEDPLQAKDIDGQIVFVWH